MALTSTQTDAVTPSRIQALLQSYLVRLHERHADALAQISHGAVLSEALRLELDGCLAECLT